MPQPAAYRVSFILYNTNQRKTKKKNIRNDDYAIFRIQRNTLFNMQASSERQRNLFLCMLLIDYALVKKCAGFQDTVLSALSTVRENVLLFCINFVQQGRRDLFLNKPAQPEERTDKIGEKIETVLSSVWNVEKTLLKTPAPAAAVDAPEIVKTEREANPSALRVRGIPESKNNEKCLRLQEDLAAVKKILELFDWHRPSD